MNCSVKIANVSAWMGDPVLVLLQRSCKLSKWQFMYIKELQHGCCRWASEPHQCCRCPRVLVSKCPCFPVFWYPSSQGSQCLGVLVSQCPGVQMSHSPGEDGETHKFLDRHTDTYTEVHIDVGPI